MYKGYDIKSGFVGIFIDKDGNTRKMEFPTEQEFIEYMRERKEEDSDD